MSKRHPGNRRRERASREWTRHDNRVLKVLIRGGCTWAEMVPYLHRSAEAIKKHALRIGATKRQPAGAKVSRRRR